MCAAISVKEANELVLENSGDFGIEKLPLEQAAGRILAEDISAERHQPPFDRVMMDGIACRAGDEFPLKCLGRHQAGGKIPTLPEGNVCWEVMTGAALPHGADCVIPVEALVRKEVEISLKAGDGGARVAGRFIHPEGSDAKKGDLLLSSGITIDGPVMALLAANGYSEVRVYCRPKIALLATGDELVDVNAAVGEGQIRRSNDSMMRGVLAEGGFAPSYVAHIPDDFEALVSALQKVLKEVDVLILSGGVSMGAFDYVPSALQKVGAKKLIHRITQRPGAPMWFGIGPEGQRIFGLPGNPVSAMACGARYVLPLLKKAMHNRLANLPSEALLAETVQSMDKRTFFLPVRLEWKTGQAILIPHKVPTSGDFMHLGETAGIAEIPAGEGEVKAGSFVAFYPW
ncbi:molybdopterin biosynthesis protein [Lasius niger]|uniref:molybdopterin adenylyltransferase n=1 Tax=Lasius niger TaxID=67767 RepID=A0A0J7NCB5_LASNI|nr:molybdopterin biosynthesis protein [Lasius niger]